MKQKTLNQSKPLIIKWYFWVIIVLITAGVTGYIFCGRNEANPQPSDKPIVANPVDLSTIKTISKFRSCAGHEFGYTSGFSNEKEAKSSMKHYFGWKDDLTDEKSVPVYAPFDGTIMHTEVGTDQFIIQQNPFAGWVFDFTHVIIKDGITEGSIVKAGEVVGYANLRKTKAFDIILQTQKKPGFKNYDWYNNYESIFDHMADNIYAQYIAKGITKDKIIISKSVRDQSPCPCDPNNPPVDKSPYCNFLPVSLGDGVNGEEMKQ